MLERPAISDGAIAAVARTSFGLSVVGVEFLPLGCDTASWSFRLRCADGADYYAKLRSGVLNHVGLQLPDLLASRGADFVISPMRTVGGALWAPCGDAALILYPFVAGRSNPALSDEQWRAFGRALRELHETALPHSLLCEVRRETYRSVGIALIRQLDEHIAAHAFHSPVQNELCNRWRAHRQTIMALSGRTERLGRQLERRGLPCVLCHADAHGGNLLAEPDGRLWLVDWDEVVLAPRECDLMFILPGAVATPEARLQAALFMEGYGAVAVNTTALAYYRHARAATDLGGFAHRALLAPEVGDEDRRAAVEWFESQFEPGEAVELALRSPASASR